MNQEMHGPKKVGNHASSKSAFSKKCKFTRCVFTNDKKKPVKNKVIQQGRWGPEQRPEGASVDQSGPAHS